MKCCRGSTNFGLLLVALWGNDHAASVLKCHETGAILCIYGLVGTWRTEKPLQGFRLRESLWSVESLNDMSTLHGNRLVLGQSGCLSPHYS